jgi:hypothetical protein
MEMEQMMSRLLTEMKAELRTNKAKAGANLEKMDATMDGNQA